MEFRTLLPKRRMVRHYAPEPVPRETVERIVGTVRRAPSAGYSQGQRLLVVMEDEGRAELARIASQGWVGRRGRPGAVARERSGARLRLHAGG